VLVRSHFLIKSRLSIPDTYENRLKDVSRFDEVNDLLSASDLLVTDYSSVLFDYLCLARPVLFFAYDLELYRDQVRGFYLDYENDLPGPLVKDVDELVNAIHRTVSLGDSGNLSDYIKRFCPFDDGNVSERVVDLLFYQ